MTLDELKQYNGIVAEINAINAERHQMYNTYQSPSFSSTGSFNGEPHSPVEQALKKIGRLEEIYMDRLNELYDRKIEIEEWVKSIDDTFVSSCIRIHFFEGHTWKETSEKVYGRESYYNARNVVLRYLKKEQKNKVDQNDQKECAIMLVSKREFR